MIDTTIITKGAIYRVNVGTQIRLPCYVDKFPESVIIMWTKGSKTQVGKKYIVVDERVYEEERGGISVEVIHDDDMMEESNASNRGSTLIINSAIKKDEGEYICTVAGRGSIEHNVNIVVGDEVEVTATTTNKLNRNLDAQLRSSANILTLCDMLLLLAITTVMTKCLSSHP